MTSLKKLSVPLSFPQCLMSLSPHPTITFPGTQFFQCLSFISALPKALNLERKGRSWSPHLPFLKLLVKIQELFPDLFGGGVKFLQVVLLEIFHHQPTYLGQQLFKSPHLGA